MERGKTRMHHKNCGVGLELVKSVWSHMYGEERREERELSVYVYIERAWFCTLPGPKYSDIPILISTSHTRYCFLNIMVYLKRTHAPCGNGCFQVWDLKKYFHSNFQLYNRVSETKVTMLYSRSPKYSWINALLADKWQEIPLSALIHLFSGLVILFIN